MRKRGWPLLLITLLCSACETTGDLDRQRDEWENLVTGNSAPYISLSGGACLGTCPDYAIHLVDDGTVHLQGRSRTAVRGILTQHVRRANYQRLKKFLLDEHAFDLRDAGDCMTDSPTFDLTMVDSDGKQTTRLDTGCGAMRESIWSIVDTFTRLTDTDRMIR